MKTIKKGWLFFRGAYYQEECLHYKNGSAALSSKRLSSRNILGVLVVF